MAKIVRLSLLCACLVLLGQLPVLAAEDGQPAAKQKIEFTAYHNDQYGFQLEVPVDFIPVERSDAGAGTSFVTKDNKFEIRVWGEPNDGKSIDQLYDATIQRLEALGEIAYKKKLPDGFIAAWWSDDDSLYLRTIVKTGTVAHLVVTCDEENIDKYNGIAAHVDRTFKLLDNGSQR